MTEDEARQLFTGEFGKKLIEATRNYCVPIFWSTPENHQWRVNNAGTAFVVGTGRRTIIVTAAHVYEYYLARRSECVDVCPQLGDLYFPIEERVIGYLGSEAIDIATFRVTPEEIHVLGRRVLQGKETYWPPPSAEVGDAALFVGFPGLQRTDKPGDECGFGFYTLLTPVSSVSERRLRV